MKKTGIFAPKTQFFPFKTQCTAGLRPELSYRKVYKKKPALKANFLSVLENNKAQNMAFTMKFKNCVATCQLQYLTHL